MKSLVVLVFAVVALSVMECSVAGTKFGFFFAHLHLLTSQGTNHHLSLKAGGGGLCEESVDFDFATTKLT